MSSSAPVRRAAETIVRFDPKAKPAQRQAKPEDSLAKPAAVAGWELPKPVPSLHDGLVPVREIGGRKDGTEPTRYGDWEKTVAASISDPAALSIRSSTRGRTAPVSASHLHVPDLFRESE